jgi:glyoxylase-like metal-dependent hydrolase (beta-lactamase superfamily II)
VKAATWIWALVLGCGDGGSSPPPAEGTTDAASTSAATTSAATSDATTSSSTGSDGSSDDATSSSSGDEGSGGSSGSTGEPSVCDGGEFPAAWQNGTACPEDPIQVHRYSENTFILRQSLCTSFEGPFLYLLFGTDRVLLEDTGDGGIPVQSTVQAVIDGWLEEHGRTSIELVVVNSHAHGDHVAGNDQFEGQPSTTVVGYAVSDLQAFFGIGSWPDDVAEYDLGDRIVDVIPIPGHQSAHIALYDRTEGLLLTGDTLYPGRLYIADFPEYVQSIGRVADFVAGQDVCHVLGTHIEMTTTPGVEIPFGSTMHANEHALPLTVDHLLELRDAVEAMGNDPMYEIHDDFIVYPL